jgi:cytochrome c5
LRSQEPHRNEGFIVSNWWNCLIAALLLVTVSVTANAVEDEIAERIKPVGKVCIEGEKCDAVTAVAATAAASNEPRSGEAVYNTACTACHSSGAGGAPIVGDGAAWADRIAQGNDTLYTHAIKGIKGMPAMGLCMDCSEEEIKVAVDYMVAGSQ